MLSAADPLLYGCRPDLACAICSARRSPRDRHRPPPPACLPPSDREDPRRLQERHLLRADEAHPRARRPARPRHDAGLPEAAGCGDRRNGPDARDAPRGRRPVPRSREVRSTLRALPRGGAPAVRGVARAAALDWTAYAPIAREVFDISPELAGLW